ncbi:hypothetical protein H2248_011279 [Termitomyces sp. 'cryptogamus']|nr:hypothetical protein H2248_011279 [Termitomyces sp. 'cryptogamus']
MSGREAPCPVPSSTRLTRPLPYVVRLAIPLHGSAPPSQQPYTTTVLPCHLHLQHLTSSPQHTASHDAHAPHYTDTESQYMHPLHEHHPLLSTPRSIDTQPSRCFITVSSIICTQGE